MTDLLYTIAVTAIALGVLITFHEWGHFWVARRCGVKVQRFSIGFGTPLLKWVDRKGTEFVIAAIPLGGYVKMLDENNEPVPVEQQTYAFNRQSLRKRIAIVSAGPLANFILAILLYYLLFLGGVTQHKALIEQVTPTSPAALAGLAPGQEIIGLNGQAIASRQALSRALLDYVGSNATLTLDVRDATGKAATYQLPFAWSGDSDQGPFDALGISFYYPPVSTYITKIMRHSPADEAGLQVGDRLLYLDSQRVDDWYIWSQAIQSRPGQKMALGVERDGDLLNIEVVPAVKSTAQGDIGQLGVIPRVDEWPPHLLVKQSYSLLNAWQPALMETWDKSVLTLRMLQKMLVGEVSVKQIGGPVTIAQQASLSSKLGWKSFVGLLALLSISLGVLNLLPIPVLDGGHLCFYLLEAVRGKPLSQRVQMMALQVGALIIFGFMIFAIYNDITRL